MATAEEGEGGEPPGLGRGRCPRFRRSEATRGMAGGGGVGGKEDGGTEPLLLSVLALPATALPAVVSRLEAAVPRKARSYLPRNVPSAWWSLRIPFLPPLPPAGKKKEDGRRFPRTQRVQVAPSLDPGTADKPPKRLKRCLHCKAVETPQRRSGPMGRGTLCNACGVWYKPDLGARGAWGHLPGQKVGHGEDASQDRSCASATAGDELLALRVLGSTFVDRRIDGAEGGLHRLRHAGRLLPEYRPVASPTFVPTKHANTHRKVLQLHRTRQSNDEHPSPLPADSVTNLPPIRNELPTTSMAGLASEDPTDAPGYTDNPINVPSSLDSLLLDGPSAPLICSSGDYLEFVRMMDVCSLFNTVDEMIKEEIVAVTPPTIVLEDDDEEEMVDAGNADAVEMVAWVTEPSCSTMPLEVNDYQRQSYYRSRRLQARRA
ncbi:GATA transcription factor 9 [Triticum urartu]|uniref:GATA transcription factor 9 n=1 Tax=Triticum urartu TaxID=4572 RepID=M7ZPG4_TRIUA|nr:GATA transcription factor 9 [Triticum urartu]